MIRPGATLAVSGAGFAPGSTVELVLHSTPTPLGSVTVDSDGSFTAQVTIPADVAGGAHEVIGSGTGADGGVASPEAAVTVDTQPPQLQSLSFSPQSVDTSSAAQTLTITAHITDDASGNAGPGYSSSPSQVLFVSPSGQQQVFGMLDGTKRISGTAQDGIYQSTVTVPKDAEQGTWHIQSLLLVDQVGNTQSLSASTLSAAGFPTTFEQTGAGDTAPPQLQSFSLSPASVNTFTGSQTVTIMARITDNLSGNAGPGYSSSPSQVLFVSPSGQQQVFGMLDGTKRISGTAQDGVYQSTIILPQYSEQGTWHVQSLLLVDQDGNSHTLTQADMTAAGFSTTFDQTGTGDTTPPQLQAFSMSPTAINTGSSSQTITITAHITDDLSGNAGAGYSSSPSQVWFVSPSGQQQAYGMLDGTKLISGTPQDGIYQSTITVPQYAECGTWQVRSFLLVDQVGNSTTLTESQMEADGLPTTFNNC